MCSSNTDSSTTDSLADIGKIAGIVIGSILGFVVLVCIIVTIYLVCCRRKNQAQVWVNSCPRPQTYGQSMPMFPYTNYPQGPIQTLQTDPQRIIESPPPPYEEIIRIDNPNRKI
jgi:hypothetical protein